MDYWSTATFAMLAAIIGGLVYGLRANRIHAPGSFQHWVKNPFERAAAAAWFAARHARALFDPNGPPSEPVTRHQQLARFTRGQDRQLQALDERNAGCAEDVNQRLMLDAVEHRERFVRDDTCSFRHFLLTPPCGQCNFVIQSVWG